MVKLTIPVTIKLVGLEDVTSQLKAAFPSRSEGRQFSKEAFWLVARQRQFDRDGQPFELLPAAKHNPFKQPEKPTDGGKKKKKKKKKGTY